MNHVLAINAAVSLIMGCALVLVWRRDQAQTFTLYIGWANLLQLLVPMTYLVKTQGSPVADMVGNYALAVIAGAYSTLVLAGLAHLAGRPMDQRQALQILVVLSVGNSVVMALGGPRLAQAGMATVNTILGMVCTYWLWNAGARPGAYPGYSGLRAVMSECCSSPSCSVMSLRPTAASRATISSTVALICTGGPLGVSRFAQSATSRLPPGTSMRTASR